MRIRFLLLAGTVLPFALNAPALAANLSAGKPLVLAQNEEQACPEGQECPPLPPPDGQPPAEEPPAEQPPAEAPPAEPPPAAEEPPPPPPEPAPAPEPAPEAAPAEQPPPEAPPPAPEPPPPPAEAAPAEQPPAEAPPPAEPPPEQPAPEQPAPEQPAPQAAPEQPAAEQPAPQAAPEQPQPEQPQQAAPEQPAPEQPQQAAPQPEAAPQESVVEQQLEAQGDQEEANRVRSLRDQLLNQLQQAVTPPPEQQQQQGSNDRRDRRDRDGRRGDRDGYWDRDDDRGDVVERRGTSIIIDLGGGNIYVEPTVPDEGGRLLYGADDVEVQELPFGRTRTIVHRENGVDIVTVRDRNGNIIKRSKFLPNGREIVLIDNRYPDEDEYRAPPPILTDVPPPRIDIPRDRYIVDLGRASDDDIRYALEAPLVQAAPRVYTLDEVLRNQEVRAYSPSIDLDTITFEFGSATISNDQMSSLVELGQAMEQVIAEHPDEVYLVEGHTDAVGSDYDNLILSDQRAEAVATALSQNFDIPPENLVTEGYGEQFLKVDTLSAERRNRRATVRRLTDLLQAQAQ